MIGHAVNAVDCLVVCLSLMPLTSSNTMRKTGVHVIIPVVLRVFDSFLFVHFSTKNLTPGLQKVNIHPELQEVGI